MALTPGSRVGSYEVIAPIGRGGMVVLRSVAWVLHVHLGGPRESRFDWARVRANREWRTALALPLLVAILYARGRWL